MNTPRRRLIHELEIAMWTTVTRGDRAWMDAHLSPTFTEFGRSGRSYTRDEILDQEIGPIDATLSAMEMREVGHNVVLVTYRSELRGDLSNRSSLWVRDGSTWLLEFHQGTPTDA